MKSSIIRARVDAGLKAKAAAVLDSCGLEMSEALRLFLIQVVRKGGLPFQVRQAAQVGSAKKLKKMKRDSQVRDRALVAQGGPVDEMFLIRPALVRHAHVIWPDVDL
jgi:DNA-damage-inducible protein J